MGSLLYARDWQNSVRDTKKYRASPPLCRLSSCLLNVNLQAVNAVQTQLWNKFLGYKFLVRSLQILNFYCCFLVGFGFFFLKKTLAYKAHLPNFFKHDLSILDSCITNKDPGGGREPQKAQHTEKPGESCAQSSHVTPQVSLLRLLQHANLISAFKACTARWGSTLYFINLNT